MKTQATTVEEANVFADRRIISREEWLIARQDLIEKENEIASLRNQLGAQRSGRAATIDRADKMDDRSSGGVTIFIKQAGLRVLGFVGPLLMAVYLLVELQKLPNSSLGYSVLSAAISLLFNFSSSALSKAS